MQLDMATGGRGMLESAGREKLENALPEQRRGAGAVRRQAGVGEVVLVARVEKELRVLGRLDDRASGVDVALPDEVRIRIHAMDLHRHIRWPGRSEFGG